MRLAEGLRAGADALHPAVRELLVVDQLPGAVPGLVGAPEEEPAPCEHHRTMREVGQDDVALEMEAAHPPGSSLGQLIGPTGYARRESYPTDPERYPSRRCGRNGKEPDDLMT